MLLTSHYMRDVEALCKRVLVITQGKLVYDGALSGITARFGGEKLVKLHFDGDDGPADLSAYGEVTSRAGPVVEIKVERNRVPDVLATILARHTVTDVSIHDPPLDQMIAKVFEQGINQESPEAVAGPKS
jgi:ABC-2 type transport system ATP-binding protein